MTQTQTQTQTQTATVPAKKTLAPSVVPFCNGISISSNDYLQYVAGLIEPAHLRDDKGAMVKQHGYTVKKAVGKNATKKTLKQTYGRGVIPDITNTVRVLALGHAVNTPKGMVRLGSAEMNAWVEGNLPVLYKAMELKGIARDALDTCELFTVSYTVSSDGSVELVLKDEQELGELEVTILRFVGNLLKKFGITIWGLPNND